MTLTSDSYGLLPDLGRLVIAGLNCPGDVSAYASRIAERLGVSEGDGALEAAVALREALGLKEDRDGQLA